MIENNVKLLFHILVCDALVEEDRVQEVIVERSFGKWQEDKQGITCGPLNGMARKTQQFRATTHTLH